MKKTLLIAALALFGAAAQANAADIVAGQVYTVRYVGENADAANPLYLNLAKPAEKVDRNTTDHNAGLSSTPCPITFTKHSSKNSYQIRAVEQFGYLNLNDDGYNAIIGSAAQYWYMNSAAADGSDELKFTIEKTTGINNRFLAADDYSDNKPLYADKTETAAWLLEPYTPTYSSYVAPQTSTADNPIYYRIISNRAACDIYNSHFHGKYMQIDGETGTAASLNQHTHIGNDSFGAYWWFEATGEDGAVIIHNLVSDYALKANGSNAVTMSEAGTPFFLINVTGQASTKTPINRIGIPNTFAISTANTITDSNCLDQSNNNGDAKVCWSPINSHENNGDENNGSAWYFELATADEVAAATTAYIAAVRANYPTVCNAGKASVIGTLNALSGVMETEAAIAAINAFESEFTATTIADANAAMTAARRGLPESALSDEVRTAMAKSLVGKCVQLKSRLVASTGHNHSYVTVNVALDATDLNNDVTDNPVRAIWEVVECDTEGKVWLRNVYADKFLKLNANDNTNNTLSAESGDAFTVRFSTVKNGFGFDAGNSLDGGGNYLALHATTLGGAGVTVRWDLLMSSDKSWFDLIAVDGQVNVTSTKGENEGEVVLNFGEGVTPTTNAAYTSEAHKLIVTPVAPAERSVAVGTEINASDIADGSVTISGLTQGEYTVTAPAGFFTVNGKLSAPISQSFTVAADGTPTGIDEVGAETSCKQVIYDLQGRRVQRASKGLYIINGVKTLVK